MARTPDGIRVFQAGKIGLLGPGAGCDGPMTKIARDFAFEPEGMAPVTIVDFKAGAEDASRGVITSLDWIVVALGVTSSYFTFCLKSILRQLQRCEGMRFRRVKSVAENPRIGVVGRRNRLRRAGNCQI